MLLCVEPAALISAIKVRRLSKNFGNKYKVFGQAITTKSCSKIVRPSTLPTKTSAARSG